jgi:Flp pilus assembly pilin Flp
MRGSLKLASGANINFGVIAGVGAVGIVAGVGCRWVETWKGFQFLTEGRAVTLLAILPVGCDSRGRAASKVACGMVDVRRSRGCVCGRFLSRASSGDSDDVPDSGGRGGAEGTASDFVGALCDYQRRARLGGAGRQFDGGYRAAHHSAQTRIGDCSGAWPCVSLREMAIGARSRCGTGIGRDRISPSSRSRTGTPTRVRRASEVKWVNIEYQREGRRLPGSIREGNWWFADGDAGDAGISVQEMPRTSDGKRVLFIARASRAWNPGAAMRPRFTRGR